MSPPPASAFDVAALARAVRAIASEFSLADLQRTVVRLIQESTEAPYAALLGTHEGKSWVIHSQTEGANRTPRELPASVLHGARRTLEPVILADATTQAPYSEDEVVRARGLRSVLCYPLTHRGLQHGLLYLENAQVPHAFDGARQGVIELLATQAAMALENARLHHQLAEQSHVQEASRREISATRQHMQALIDNSPATIYVKDEEGRYLMINKPFEAFFGVPRSEILGRKDADLFPLDQALQFMANDFRVLSTGATLQFEEEVPHPDGMHYFISSKFPLRKEDGSIHAVCGISTDITTRKRAEETLQRVNEELEHRVAERTEQLHAAQQELLERARHAGMAETATSILHNLGNALTGITVSSAVLRERIHALPIGSLGRAASLLDRPAEDLGTFITQDERGRKLPEYLNRIHTRFLEEQRLLLEECTALSTKIDHTNGVIATQQSYARSRISQREKVQLSELAEDALRLCTIGDQYDKLIQREYGEEEPELYERHVVVQILVNLISNAKNAVRERPDNPQPRITLSIRQDPAWTIVAVSDNGVGFDQNVKAQLFTHGFTTRTKGHGFGLHSAAVSAESLGGRIEAYSEGPGQGARFELILPRPPPNP